MTILNPKTNDELSYDLLIRSVIYLLAAVSAIRGIVSYPEQWLPITLVLIPFILVTTLEVKVRQLGLALILIYLAIQLVAVVTLYIVAPFADYWAILLLPSCYFVVQQFSPKVGFSLVGLFTVTMTISLWAVEGGLGSLQFSVVYSVAYFMVAAFSWIIRQLIISRNSAHHLRLELEQTNIQLRAHADRSANIAIIEERTAVARELHDSVTQTLFSVNLLLNALEHKYPEQPAAQKHDIEKIAQLSDSAVKELRAIINQLKPASPTLRHFSSEVRDMIREIKSAYELEVQFLYDDRAIPRLVTTGVLKILREALLNIAKHADNKIARINVNTDTNGLNISVADTGPGFNQKDLKQGHMGLESMRLTSSELGGTLTINSKLGQGTTVQLNIPRLSENQGQSL